MTPRQGPVRDTSLHVMLLLIVKTSRRSPRHGFGAGGPAPDQLMQAMAGQLRQQLPGCAAIL
jgi:hypothetical protein